MVTTLQNKDVNVFICFLLFSPQVPQRKSQTGYFDLDTSLIHCRGVPWATNKRYDFFFLTLFPAIVPLFQISLTFPLLRLFYIHCHLLCTHTLELSLKLQTTQNGWLNFVCVFAGFWKDHKTVMSLSSRSSVPALHPPASAFWGTLR